MKTVCMRTGLCVFTRESCKKNYDVHFFSDKYEHICTISDFQEIFDICFYLGGGNIWKLFVNKVHQTDSGGTIIRNM
jgi:hypothetical protein